MGRARPAYLDREFAVRAVRYLLRVSVLMLAGVAVFFGLVLLLNAQALLNRYAELYMMDTEGSSASASKRINVAHRERFLPSSTVEPVRADHAPGSEPRAPLSRIVAADTERAIYVSGAESIASVAAPERWVDVILTHQSGSSATFSEVVLENVKVLTIELITAERGIGERSALHAVTLDVDSDTVENLLLSSRSGKLSLALHRPRENRHQPEVQTGGPEVAGALPVSAPEVLKVAGPKAAGAPSVSAPDAARAVMPEVASNPPALAPEAPQAPTPEVANDLQPSAPQARQTTGPELAESPPPPAPQAQQTNSREVANITPASEPDDERFAVVTVHRVGGTSSTYRVPRER
jgi:Flp pilus assembly protein CpaB